MPDALDLTYLALVALVGLLAFWDAPVRLYRAVRRDAVTRSRRYHAVNVLSVLLLVGWAVVLWTGLDTALLPGRELPSSGRLVGLTVAIGGLGYGLWAKLVMGPSFAPTAAVPEDERVVTGGPFAQVRHPFYVGMWTALLGGCLVLDSLTTMGLAVVLVPIVREIAILEEEHLSRRLGGAYTTYARRVPRFVPGREPGPVGRSAER